MLTNFRDSEEEKTRKILPENWPLMEKYIAVTILSGPPKSSGIFSKGSTKTLGIVISTLLSSIDDRLVAALPVAIEPISLKASNWILSNSISFTVLPF
jgi:hypothetical protein